MRWIPLSTGAVVGCMSVPHPARTVAIVIKTTTILLILFLWKGYFISENAWVKKIPASELNKEKHFLASLGLDDYKVKNKL